MSQGGFKKLDITLRHADNRMLRGHERAIYYVGKATSNT